MLPARIHRTEVAYQYRVSITGMGKLPIAAVAVFSRPAVANGRPMRPISMLRLNPNYARYLLSTITPILWRWWPQAKKIAITMRFRWKASKTSPCRLLSRGQSLLPAGMARAIRLRPNRQCASESKRYSTGPSERSEAKGRPLSGLGSQPGLGPEFEGRVTPAR